MEGLIPAPEQLALPLGPAPAPVWLIPPAAPTGTLRHIPAGTRSTMLYRDITPASVCGGKRLNTDGSVILDSAHQTPIITPRLPPAATLLALLRLHTSHLIRSHIRPCSFSTSSSRRDLVISTSASGPSQSLAGSWTHGAVITPPTPIYRAAQLGGGNAAVLKPWQASAKNHQRTRPHESCMEPTSGNHCRSPACQVTSLLRKRVAACKPVVGVIRLFFK